MIAVTTCSATVGQLGAHLVDRLGGQLQPVVGGAARAARAMDRPFCLQRTNVTWSFTSDGQDFTRPSAGHWSHGQHLPYPPAPRPGPGRCALRERLRRLAEAAVTPLELDDVLDVFHPLRSGAELRGRIVAVVPETAESATIVIKPGRDWAGHVPGQYVRVGVDVDGVRLWRTYSLTHGPRPDRCISITVKAIPDGVVSNHLVHRARAGQMLQLEQAEGEFVLPQPLPDKLLLVTAGSGITPVIGMLRNLFSRADAGRAPTSCCVHVNAHRVRPRSSATSCGRTPPPARSR